MSTIDLRRTHRIGKEKARLAVEFILRDLQAKLKVTYRWQGDEVRFQRPGADGTIRVSDTEVRFQADLGLLLRPLRPVIEREVKGYFDRHLGNDQA